MWAPKGLGWQRREGILQNGITTSASACGVWAIVFAKNLLTVTGLEAFEDRLWGLTAEFAVRLPRLELAEVRQFSTGLLAHLGVGCKGRGLLEMQLGVGFVVQLSVGHAQVEMDRGIVGVGLKR